MNNLSSFIKYQRRRLGLTQETLARKAGVGLRFIREMEQGKETLRLDKVNQVLALLGFELLPGKQHLDAYDIYWNYCNKAVKITLINNLLKYGVIIGEIQDKKEHKITAWRFVSNRNAIRYHQKPDDELIETIEHADIYEIEVQ